MLKREEWYNLLIVSLIAYILASCGIVAWNSLEQSKPYDYSEPAKGNHQYYQSAPRPGPPSTNQPNNHGSHESHWYDTFSAHTTEWLLVLFNLMLAFYTAKLFYATSGLVAAAQEQSSDTKASIAVAREAANAAEKAAVAAVNQANVMESGERPYLLIKKIIPDIKVHRAGMSDHPSADCTIKNFGKGLAILKIAGSQLRTSRDTPPGTLSEIPKFPRVLESGEEHTFTVPFGGAGETPLSTEKTSEIQDAEAFSGSTSRLPTMMSVVVPTKLKANGNILSSGIPSLAIPKATTK